MGRRPKISREDVLQAAREAFAERGFEGTTLAGIATRLGVSPAALLRHAPNKEALFASAMSHHGPGDFPIPVEFLAALDGTENPRAVVRRIGEEFVPFLESKLDEQVAHWMRSKTVVEKAGGLPAAFRSNLHPTPPQRALRLIEGYLRRAAAAGRLRVSDPLSAALMLLSAFQAYVMLHKVARILDPPLPLDRYIDTVVEVWLCGAGESEEGRHEAQDRARRPAGRGRPSAEAGRRTSRPPAPPWRARSNGSLSWSGSVRIDLPEPLGPRRP